MNSKRGALPPDTPSNSVEHQVAELLSQGEELLRLKVEKGVAGLGKEVTRITVAIALLLAGIVTLVWALCVASLALLGHLIGQEVYAGLYVALSFAMSGVLAMTVGWWFTKLRRASTHKSTIEANTREKLLEASVSERWAQVAQASGKEAARGALLTSPEWLKSPMLSVGLSSIIGMVAHARLFRRGTNGGPSRSTPSEQEAREPMRGRSPVLDTVVADLFVTLLGAALPILINRVIAENREVRSESEYQTLH